MHAGRLGLGAAIAVLLAGLIGVGCVTRGAPTWQAGLTNAMACAAIYMIAGLLFATAVRHPHDSAWQEALLHSTCTAVSAFGLCAYLLLVWHVIRIPGVVPEVRGARVMLRVPASFSDATVWALRFACHVAFAWVAFTAGLLALRRFCRCR